MKKRLFFATAGLLACTVALTGYRIYNNITMTDKERLLLQNIEALSGEEEGEKDTCYSYYVLGNSDIYGCPGQHDDLEPKKCELVAWARGYDNYKRVCLKE